MKALVMVFAVVLATGCGGGEEMGLWGDWSGTVVVTPEWGDQEQSAFTIPTRLYVRDAFAPCSTNEPLPLTVSNLCPIGGGTLTLPRGALSWQGAVTCTPIRAWGCTDMTFVIETFTLIPSGNTMSATARGIATGCKASGAVVLGYDATRAPIAGDPAAQPATGNY